MNNLICLLRFQYENDVRFFFTSSCLWEGSCSIYVICVCLRVVVSKMDNPDKLATSRKDEEKTQHNMCFTPLFCKQIQITQIRHEMRILCRQTLAWIICKSKNIKWPKKCLVLRISIPPKRENKWAFPNVVLVWTA